MTTYPPRILFFNINGMGMGHLSRCLAYARRIQDRARPVFFSLASAVETIHDMGFEADYFVSESWSRSRNNAWNRELAVRVGLLLEEVRPAVVVFDGTWPFHGLMNACDAWGVASRVWSNRGMHKAGSDPVPVDESRFDLVIQPGEVGAQCRVDRAGRPGRKVTTEPVTLLEHDEILARDVARDALGLDRAGRYALFSLSNFKGAGGIALGLIEELRDLGFTAVWARAPISVTDTQLPGDVMSIAVYPLVRYMRAFDVFVGTAGYNTCCEVLQSSVPSLLVPNPAAADDQAARAAIASQYAPVTVLAGDTQSDRHAAVTRLLELSSRPADRPAAEMEGAGQAADEIVALVTHQGTI